MLYSIALFIFLIAMISISVRPQGPQPNSDYMSFYPGPLLVIQLVILPLVVQISVSLSFQPPVRTILTIFQGIAPTLLDLRAALATQITDIPNSKESVPSSSLQVALQSRMQSMLSFLRRSLPRGTESTDVEALNIGPERSFISTRAAVIGIQPPPEVHLGLNTIRSRDSEAYVSVSEAGNMTHEHTVDISSKDR